MPAFEGPGHLSESASTVPDLHPRSEATRRRDIPGDMRRLGIRIANVALFTLCCFLLADVFNKISADLLLPSGGAAPPPAPAPERRVRSWDERKPILQRNLFGAQVVSDPIAYSEPEPEDIEKTELPLQLLGTIASDNPETARATIWDEKERHHQVLRTGDQLEHHADVRLERIERRRVILLNGESREELNLEDRKIEREVASAPKAKSSSRRRRSRRRTVTPSPEASGDAERNERISSQLETLREERNSDQLDDEDLAERLKALRD